MTFENSPSEEGVDFDRLETEFMTTPPAEDPVSTYAFSTEIEALRQQQVIRRWCLDNHELPEKYRPE